MKAQDCWTIRTSQGRTALYSIQYALIVLVSADPHEGPVIRVGVNLKTLGGLPGIIYQVGMHQEPESEAEPDFLTTSLSSSVPGSHDVQIVHVI